MFWEHSTVIFILYLLYCTQYTLLEIGFSPIRFCPPPRRGEKTESKYFQNEEKLKGRHNFCPKCDPWDAPQAPGDFFEFFSKSMLSMNKKV